MGHRVLWRSCLVALVLPAFTGYISAQVRSKPAVSMTQIRGQVRLAHGPAAPEGVLVRLEAERGGLVGQMQTDSQGKFIFTQIPQQGYVISASHPGYQQALERVDLNLTPTAFVSLTLVPLPSSDPRALPPEGPSAHLAVSLVAVPENARREFEKGQRLLKESKDPKASISFLRKAIQIHPSFAQAHVLLGTAYMDMGKWKDAEPALLKAIELDDKLAGAYLALGACYNQAGNFAEAEKRLQRGLQLDPQSAMGHYELGRACWALGRWPDAEPHARKAVELKPDLAVAHVLMGNIMLRKRDANAALREFREYLRLDPEGRLAAPTKEMVGKIEKALASQQ